jgi:hypothetical protein
MLYQDASRKCKESDIVHRDKLTDIVKDRAAQIEAELSKLLQEAPGKISFTFDGWTSAIMRAYIAVTTHYINDDWELKSELLAFEELEGSHTGENLAEVLYTILDLHRIKHKV